MVFLIEKGEIQVLIFVVSITLIIFAKKIATKKFAI